MEMVPVPNARKYTPQVLSPEVVAAFVCRQNGFWARVENGVVLWDLMTVFVSNSDIIPTPLTAADADALGSRIAAMDVAE